jgi:hypothetical protein
MGGWLGRLNRLTSPAPLADWYDRLVARMFSVWRRYQLLPFSLEGRKGVERGEKGPGATTRW